MLHFFRSKSIKSSYGAGNNAITCQEVITKTLAPVHTRNQERSQKIPESQIWRETVVKKQSPNNSWTLFNRPGAVLQSPMLLIHSVGQRVIHFFSPNLQDTSTFKPYELGALKGRKMLLSLEQRLVQTIFAFFFFFFYGRFFFMLMKESVQFLGISYFFINSKKEDDLTSASYFHARHLLSQAK